ncbi:flagellar hook-basal body complex protein FliE [Polycladidibacter stylochi]|uniref:flagellar hook-basal body complex protein FliE n=1 Tax=Polycladidibacter stylochi TaxID=1807766 RepID=UPI00083452F6|nr:flagellar hook-basal body complex protein FliE [Pseudovibrio stylochi]
MANPTIAASAYSAAANLLNPADSAEGGAGSDPAFGQLVQSAIEEVKKTGQASEAQTLDLVQGKANVVDLVTAVSETELAMETVVSVRDRVISAYEEIMRMPI